MVYIYLYLNHKRIVQPLHLFDLHVVFTTSLDLAPALWFTSEFGGNSLPFLDTEITLKSDSFTSTVYRKPTTTGVTINSSAVAPASWKSGLIKCFLHRAHNVCSDNKLLDEEISKLKNIFLNNGHSARYFDKITQEFLDKKRKEKTKLTAMDVDAVRTESETEADTVKEISKSETNMAKEKSTKLMLKIPFIGKPSIVFARRIKNLMNTVKERQIRIVYETSKIQQFIQRKDVPPKEILSRVVYKFNCSSDSNANYIGYTNRTLKERVKEHLSGNTAISDHISECKTCSAKRITIDDFEVLKCCRSKRDTAIYEALFIKKFKPGLNHQLVKPGYTWHLQVFNQITPTYRHLVYEKVLRKS